MQNNTAIPDYSHHSKFELLELVVNSRTCEREATADLVLALREFDRRKLYLDEGYTSLYAFCQEKLKLSEGASMRRINAARVLEHHPEVYQKLRDGSLSLCAVAEIYKVLRKEKAPELVAKAVGKSRQEVAELVAARQAPVLPKKEKVVPIKISRPEMPAFKSSYESEEEKGYSISLHVDPEFMELYRRVQLMVGEREMKGVLSKALKEYERRHCPKRRQARREKRKAKSVSVSPSSSSYSPSSGPLSVPAEVRDEVYLRDNGQCTFVGPDGNRCTCRTKLELDHVLPRAKGGSNHASNLRLTCKPHNQLYAELHFGKDLMQRKRA